MNETLKFLNSHASVRQFTDQQITATEQETILYTAQRSPTSSNIQAYTIISVRDQQTKKKLAKLSGGQSHVAECSLFLIFCADLYRLSQLNEKRDYDFEGGLTELFIQATIDAALVAGRALQAAQAMGLGGVMVGGLRGQIAEVSELLELPRLTYPIMGLSLGCPVNEPTIKPRLPLAGIHCEERYDATRFDQAVDEYDQTIDNLGYLKNREVKPDDYPDFDGLYSWSEHTARRMSMTEGPGARDHMLGYLQSQGFLKK